MEFRGQSVDHFDPMSAQTIFWENVPFLQQREDRDDIVEELSVRLLAGHARHNHALKVLRIYIFNEEDLLFLHTLEVSEEDFQTLKVEQGILVDFTNFSCKIIDLLKRCIESRGQETPRFRAALNLSEGESVFKMVETNDFKQLVHINLCFRPGTDLAIKSFLAFRLTEMHVNCQSLQCRLQDCETKLVTQTRALSEQKAAFEDMEARHTRSVVEADAAAKVAVTNARHQHMQEREALMATVERAKDAAYEQHMKEAGLLQERGARLEVENRELREQKYSIEAELAELRLKLSSVEHRDINLQEEVTNLHKQVQSLSREKGDLQVEVSDTRSKLMSSTERANMQEKVMQQQAQRIQDLDISNKQLDRRCSDLHNAATGHEHRAKEAAISLSKRSQSLERLSGDLQVCKEKLKRKQAVLVRQEEEVNSRDQALETAGKEVQDLKRQLAAGQEDALRMESTVTDLRSKLEESKEQLKGNEQMIRWLNTQVNEAQLAVARPPVSRYSFKPSTSAASADTVRSAYGRGHGGNCQNPATSVEQGSCTTLNGAASQLRSDNRIATGTPGASFSSAAYIAPHFQKPW